MDKFKDLYGFNFLEWKRLKFLLRVLSTSLLDLMQSEMALNSLFHLNLRSTRFLHEYEILVFNISI